MQDQSLLLKEIDPKLNFSITDRWKNELTCTNGRVRLALQTEPGRVRKIGDIFWHEYYLDGKDKPSVKLLTYAKDEDIDQIYRKLNAWSVFDEILQRVQVVVYFTNTHMYRIRAEKALKCGKYQHHLNAGIERKVYINLAHWTKLELLSKQKKKLTTT